MKKILCIFPKAFASLQRSGNVGSVKYVSVTDQTLESRLTVEAVTSLLQADLTNIGQISPKYTPKITAKPSIVSTCLSAVVEFNMGRWCGGLG